VFYYSQDLTAFGPANELVDDNLPDLVAANPDGEKALSSAGRTHWLDAS